MQSDSSIMQLVSPMILMHSRLHELGLQTINIMFEVQVTVSLDLYHINDMTSTTITCKSVVLEFNIREITQRDLWRAIMKSHDSDI